MLPNSRTILTRHDFDQNPAPDRRVLEHFVVGQAWDSLHYATVAEEAISRCLFALSQLIDISTSLAESGLYRDQEKIRELRAIEDLKERCAILSELHAQLRRDRQERLEAIAETEEVVRKRARQERLKSQIKASKRPRRKQAEKTFLPPEEPKAPGLNLDPKLLAEAARALTVELDLGDENEKGEKR